jgi:hypothetical protein
MSHPSTTRPRGPRALLLATLSTLLLLGSLAPLAPAATAQATAPELTAPADGAVVEGLPLFSWTVPGAAAGATSRLEIATDAGFDEIVLAVEVTERSYQQIQALVPGAPYRWRVGVVEPEGRVAWSQPWASPSRRPPTIRP